MSSESKATKYPRPIAAWTAVIILSLTYMFSFLDRQILVLLIEPIKSDLNITDTQVSLITGLAFAVIYTVMGVPMGRIADLWVRKYVIIIGVSIWSAMTVYAGLARNFSQLFMARMGVGFGEAALTPAAYAIIADLFPPNRMAFAMSVFALGGSAIGVGASLLLGGYVIGVVGDLGPFFLPGIGEIKAWQMVLIVVGIISFLMVIPLAILPEPKRQHVKPLDGQIDSSFREVLRSMYSARRFYGLYITGMCFAAISSYGTAAWIPTYFIRIHGWEASSAGITLGMAYIVPALIGGLMAGWFADRLYSKGIRKAPLVIMVASIVIASPLVFLFIFTSSIGLKWVFLVLLYLVSAVWGVLFPTVIQLATPSHSRAQVSSIHLLFVNLAGIGFGPTAVALMTDFGFQDEMAVGSSIAIIGSGSYAVSALFLYLAIRPFKTQCDLLMAE